MNRKAAGSIVGVLSAIAFGFAMVPLRSHVSIATAALILIIPVVAGVSIGGTAGGFASVVAGFLVYDFAFIPPYNTLSVGSVQNWIALGVYVVVMAVVARLVANLHEAQEAAEARATSSRHLLDLSELLLAESAGLDETIVRAVRRAFNIESVALLHSNEGRLEVLASSGTPFSTEELAELQPGAHLPIPLSTGGSDRSIQTLALASSGRPVGMLVLRNVPTTRAVREALPILANHLAVALERGQLRVLVHHAELLEEIDRLRQSLVGAVSHDLRTPLATIKAVSSTLVQSSEALPPQDLQEMFLLIDRQTDRLTRLVNNLLDMTRIQSGALEVRTEVLPVRQLIDDAISALRTSFDDREIEIDELEGQLFVSVDPPLVTQVLVNLIDNANRHAPLDTPIVIGVTPLQDSKVAISVADSGEGVPVGERESIFETFVRFDTGGRSGLGLAIAKAFVEAHGDRIWVEDAPSGGARFVFTLPRVTMSTLVVS